MLVTPLKDGMNLVAKEFVTVQSAVGAPGALVLSEFTGAASEMQQAFHCNPFDVEGVSRVLEATLEVPADERLRRLNALARRVKRHDIHVWAKREIGP